MATFPSFDLSTFELPKFDLPKFDLPKFDLPKVDLPKFDLPKFDLPKFDLPTVEAPALPEVDVDRLVGLARDAVYVGVGIAVLAVQQTEQRTRELRDAVEAGVAKLTRTAA